MNRAEFQVFPQKVQVEWLSTKSVSEIINSLGPTRSKLCPKDDESKIQLKIRFEPISRDPYDGKVFGVIVISSLRRNKTQKAFEHLKELVEKLARNEKAAEQQALQFRQQKADVWNPEVSV
jgi:hypothetical protein